MAIIPPVNNVFMALESGTIAEPHRGYIGYSGIGGKCKRKIWLSFHWVYEKFMSKRMARIFQRGHLEEQRIIDDLIEAGMTVTMTQYGITDLTGHIQGHIDGVVHCVPGYDPDESFLLEIKTMNQKRYDEYMKVGIKQSAFAYYVQMNMYMGMLDIDKCLFIVTNKNTEERSYEIYSFDSGCFEDHSSIALDILTSSAPPRIGPKTYFECKMCDAYNFCQKRDIPPLMNCRTCKHSSIAPEGKWMCLRFDKALEYEDQVAGCKHHEYSYEVLECLS